MAITTVDGTLGGAQSLWPWYKAAPASSVIGRPYSTWPLAGFPGAGTYSTSLAGAALSSSSAYVTGAIPHTDPGAGNSYVARVTGAGAQQGMLLLCDRLWHNGGFSATSTSAQTVSSVAWPARDNSGTTNGAGVFIGVECSTAMGATAPTITLAYTNSAGTASRSATNFDANAASLPLSTFLRLGTQAGDMGVQSIQSLTLSATWTSGTFNLVAYRVLGQLAILSASLGDVMDAITSGFPQLYNGVVPFFIFIPATTTAGQLFGTYTETQG